MELLRFTEMEYVKNDLDQSAGSWEQVPVYVNPDMVTTVKAEPPLNRKIPRTRISLGNNGWVVVVGNLQDTIYTLVGV